MRNNDLKYRLSIQRKRNQEITHRNKHNKSINQYTDRTKYRTLTQSHNQHPPQNLQQQWQKVRAKLENQQYEKFQLQKQVFSLKQNVFKNHQIKDQKDKAQYLHKCHTIIFNKDSRCKKSNMILSGKQRQKNLQQTIQQVAGLNQILDKSLTDRTAILNAITEQKKVILKFYSVIDQIKKQIKYEQVVYVDQRKKNYLKQQLGSMRKLQQSLTSKFKTKNLHINSLKKTIDKNLLQFFSL